MNSREIRRTLKSLARPGAVEGMARFGIATRRAYGVSLPDLRRIAQSLGKSHDLALRLWQEDSRETRILASMVELPAAVTEEQADSWAGAFDNWEICDQCCMNLFEDLPFAYRKCLDWSTRDEEFVKRAGYVLIARLAVSDKTAGDSTFEAFFPLIKDGSSDERGMVRKGVNWALRQIGKRNSRLNKKTISLAEEILRLPSRSSRWVAADALRELRSVAVQRRLQQSPR